MLDPVILLSAVLNGLTTGAVYALIALGLTLVYGVLHIINNYTGDKMAFDMGKELAEAEDVTIATLVVDDDVAVKDSTYTVGRRGVAGNFFVIKAVGAAAAETLGEVCAGTEAVLLSLPDSKAVEAVVLGARPESDGLL